MATRPSSAEASAATKQKVSSTSSSAEKSAPSTKQDASAAKRSRFGEADPLDAFMAGLEDHVKDEMSSTGQRKPEEKVEPVLDKHKAGAMKGAIQHHLKQRYKAKLNQMRGPRSSFIVLEMESRRASVATDGERREGARASMMKSMQDYIQKLEEKELEVIKLKQEVRHMEKEQAAVLESWPGISHCQRRFRQQMK
eukprot:symbB.v1.2.035522.t1/scaffold4803.1/size34571/3